MGRSERIGYHLKRALAEYAQAIGKQVEQLEPGERQQAFYDYRRAGRQFEGAEMPAITVQDSEFWPGRKEVQMNTDRIIEEYAASHNARPDGLTSTERARACLDALLTWARDGQGAEGGDLDEGK